MIKLREWIVLITFVTIMSAVFLCIVPSGKMKAAFGILCGVVIVYAAISPLVGIDIDDVDFDVLFSNGEEESESYSALSDGAMLLAAQDSIAAAAEEALTNAGLISSRIEAKCEMQNGEIVLSEITVFCSFDEAGKEKAAKVLERFFSENTKIIFVTGEKNE